MAWVAYRTWVTGEIVTAALLNQQIRDNGSAEHPDGVTPTSWAPTLEAVTANPDAGEIAETGEEFALGGLHFCWATWTMSTFFVTAGTGVYFVTLPASASGLTSAAGLGGQAIGSWSAVDDSASGGTSGTVLLRAAAEAHFMKGDALAVGLVTDASPWSWAADDVLSFTAVYPTA